MRTLLATLALTSLSSLAFAQAPATAPAPQVVPPELSVEPPADPPGLVPPPDAAKRITAANGAVVTRDFEMGFSVFGLANGSFMTEPSDQDKVDPATNQMLLYPGFGGASGGAGLNVIGSYRGIVGLEVGFYFSADRGSGSIQDYEFTIGQKSVHVPILLRVAAPLDKGVRPFVFGGPDIVIPGDAEVTNVAPELERISVNGQPLTLNAHADTYLAWAAGFGLEFLLPLDGQDFRIPLTFRANLNPDVGPKAVDRLKKPITQYAYDYNTEWEIQAVVTLGFGWYFL